MLSECIYTSGGGGTAQVITETLGASDVKISLDHKAKRFAYMTSGGTYNNYGFYDEDNLGSYDHRIEGESTFTNKPLNASALPTTGIALTRGVLKEVQNDGIVFSTSTATNYGRNLTVYLFE